MDKREIKELLALEVEKLFKHNSVFKGRKAEGIDKLTLFERVYKTRSSFFKVYTPPVSLRL